MSDYYENIGIGEQPVTGYEKFQQTERLKNEDPTAYLEAAFQEAMSPFAIQRIWERRSSQFEDDSQWVIPEQDEKDIDENYNIEESKYLRESGSEQEFLARRNFIKEDRDRQLAMSLGGAKGVVANLAFSLFDPVWLATGAVTGGLGYGSKAVGLAKAARIAALSGLEAAAVESVLVQGNTQRDTHNILHALAGGIAIGGVLGGISGIRSARIARASDMAETALRTDAENAIANDIVDGFPKTVSPLDTKKIRRYVDTRTVELNRAYDSAKAWTNKKIGETKKVILGLERDIQKEEQAIRNTQSSMTYRRKKLYDEQTNFIKKAEPERQAIRDEYSVKMAKQQERINKAESNVVKKDTPKNQAKLWKEEMRLRELASEQAERLAAVETKLKGRVNAAEFKFRQRLNTLIKSNVEKRDNLRSSLVQHKADLDLAIQSRRAGKELKMWNMMNDEQKARHIFGDELPTIDGEVRRQIRGFKAINPEANVNVAETVGVETLSDGLEASTVQAVTQTQVGSAGAAQAGFRPIRRMFDISQDAQTNLNRFAFDGGKVPDDLRGRRLLPKFTRGVQAIQTRLSNSNDMVVRGLAYHLFEAGQGGSSNPAGTAALMSDLYGKQFRSAMRGRLKDGLELWRKNQGISVMDSIFKPEIADNFYKKVMQEIRHPGSHADQGIKDAAEGVRDLFELAGKTRKAAGEAGFENLKLNRNYVSTIVDEVKIKNAVAIHGKDKVTELLSEAYQRGGYALPKNVADYIARGYVARSLDNSLGLHNFQASVKSSDLEAIKTALQKGGLAKDEIDQILTETAEENLRQGISNRAKKSFEPDLTVELNGLKMIDLVDSDLPKLIESYTREAAGGSAMARLGFKTRRQAMEFLRDVKKGAYNNGHNPADIESEVQILEDGINLIYGRSINRDASSKFIRNLSRLRDITSMLRLQTMGISTIPELARITGQRGIGTVLEACPDLGIVSSKGLRKGGKYSGHLTRPDLDEMEQMLYYVGEDHVLYPGYLRIDNIEESAMYTSVEGAVDNMLAKGKRVQEVISAFRMIQGSGEKLAVRSLATQIKKWADDIGKPLSESNIKDAGWHSGFMDELKTWMQANPKTELSNGKNVRMFNFGKMPVEMQEQLVTGMHRLVMRDMQRPFIGELPTFMNKWFGQTLTQFRNFSILSLGKQMMHDIRHDAAAGSIIALHSLFMSYAAYSIYVLSKGLGRPDQEEYYKRMFSPGEIAFGMANRMGQLASVGIAGDFMATLGLLPDSLMAAPGQSGYRGMTTTTVPVLGMGQDALRLGKDAVEMMKGELEPSKGMRDLQRVVPFGRAIGINQAFNAISGSLED